MPKTRPLLLVATLLTILTVHSQGLEPKAAAGSIIRVDPKAGSDTNDGRTKPVKTITRGLRLAKPGDTVELAQARYFESADLSRKKGEPGKPITLEGNGSVLDGSELARAADWEALGDGLFRKVKLIPRMSPAILGRWFFLFGDRMNHMGRTSKGRSAPLKKPADLQPGEWTYVNDEDAFYIRLKAGEDFDAAKIRYPLRSSGVVLSGEGAHLVVRNVIATHVHNDGFNIHGAQRDTVFENIAAIECGDDGFSAHEDAECRIDGFVSIGNSTGLCDTVSSITHYRNVFIRDCLGFDVFFIGDSPHSIENAVIESSAQRAFFAVRHTDRPQVGECRVQLRNVLLKRVGGGPQELYVGPTSRVDAERCTFSGLSVRLDALSAMIARNCSIVGDPQPELVLNQDSAWLGIANHYALSAIKLRDLTYSRATFSDFHKMAGSDVDSRWVESGEPAGTGADAESLAPVVAAAEKALQTWRTLY